MLSIYPSPVDNVNANASTAMDFYSLPTSMPPPPPPPSPPAPVDYNVNFDKGQVPMSAFDRNVSSGADKLVKIPFKVDMLREQSYSGEDDNVPTWDEW